MFLSSVVLISRHEFKHFTDTQTGAAPSVIGPAEEDEPSALGSGAAEAPSPAEAPQDSQARLASNSISPQTPLCPSKVILVLSVGSLMQLFSDLCAGELDFPKHELK